MFIKLTKALVLLIAAISASHAAVITLVNTIPSGNLFLQPSVLTGAAPVFGPGGGVVVAEGFTSPVSATLSQISVAVEYEDLAFAGVMGRSPMLLTLFSDSGNSPGTPIESWTVPLSPSATSLTVVTVSSVHLPVLLTGRQYWLSEVPADPVHTGIGWGLAAPGTLLPMTENSTGVNSGWGPTQLNLANEFSVSGTVAGAAVPEPSTFGIAGLAVMFIVKTNRRRATVEAL